MNKGDLVSKIMEKSSLSKAQASDALNAALDSIGEALRENDKVTLVGFGTFSLNHRPAREGRNPSNGKTIKIDAKNQVKFKPGKELSDSVN